MDYEKLYRDFFQIFQKFIQRIKSSDTESCETKRLLLPVALGVVFPKRHALIKVRLEP